MTSDDVVFIATLRFNVDCLLLVCYAMRCDPVLRYSVFDGQVPMMEVIFQMHHNCMYHLSDFTPYNPSNTLECLSCRVMSYYNLSGDAFDYRVLFLEILTFPVCISIFFYMAVFGHPILGI